MGALLGGLLPSPHFLRVLKTSNSTKHLAEVELASPAFIGRTVKQLSLKGCEVISVGRDGKLISPYSSAALLLGDMLMLAGTRKSIALAREALTSL